MILPGESGLVRVSLDLKLVEVADPVKLQTLEMQQTIDELEVSGLKRGEVANTSQNRIIQSVFKPPYCFQALHMNQIFIMDLAEDRLAHSVEGQTEISGEITIRDINVDIVSILASRMIIK